jgi:hypothetical protein
MARIYIDGLDAVLCCVFGQEMDENKLRTTHETNAGKLLEWENMPHI